VTAPLVAFEVACRDTEGVEFIRPEEVLAAAPKATRRLRLPFRWQVEVSEAGKLHRLGVETDRVLGLRFAGKPEQRRLSNFFMEADRDTMPVMCRGLTQTSFRRKLLAYRETWRRGLHRGFFGIENFRVLTVTTSKERVRDLVAGQRLFLFAKAERLGSRDRITHEWLDGRGERVRLPR
jgi:hypothetical protein